MINLTSTQNKNIFAIETEENTFGYMFDPLNHIEDGDSENIDSGINNSAKYLTISIKDYDKSEREDKQRFNENSKLEKESDLELDFNFAAVGDGLYI